MLYLIHAFEGIFQGLHGIEEWDIVDCESEEEVNDILEEECYTLMEEYSDVTDTLNEDIERNITDDMDQTDIDQLTEEVYAENLDGEFWKIHSDEDITLLMKELERDHDGFIDKYCY